MAINNAEDKAGGCSVHLPKHAAHQEGSPRPLPKSTTGGIRPSTDPTCAVGGPPNQSPEPPASLGCERSHKAMESSCPTSSTTCSDPGPHAQSCLFASPPAGPRQERPATLQETSTLTCDPKLTLLALPVLGQAVCANGFPHSHCGHGKGPTLLCTGVERWNASLPGGTRGTGKCARRTGSQESPGACPDTQIHVYAHHKT